MRLMLVEDDPLLGEGLVTALSRQGYAVDWFRYAKEADLAIKSGNAELIVLDWQLPDGSGVSLLEAWRKNGLTTPVLMLTARDALEDKITGLDSGADDYLIKPFDTGELYARLRALARRPVEQTTPVLSNGELQLDPSNLEVSINGHSNRLPRREFALLMELMRNLDRVVTRDQLIESLYNWNDDPESNTLEVHVHNLRKKIGNDLIRTVRGVGYIMPRITESAP